MNKKLIILMLILSTGLINGSSRKNLKRSLEQSLPEEVDPKFTSLLNAPEIYESFPDLEGLELILPVGIEENLLSKEEQRKKSLEDRRKLYQAKIAEVRRRDRERKRRMTPEQKSELKIKQKEYYIAKKAAMTPEQLEETKRKKKEYYLERKKK